jgi:hypothetical protein
MKTNDRKITLEKSVELGEALFQEGWKWLLNLGFW